MPDNKIEEYCVLAQLLEGDGVASLVALDNNVNKAIANGWQPYGEFKMYGRTAFQVIVKYS